MATPTWRHCSLRFVASGDSGFQVFCELWKILTTVIPTHATGDQVAMLQEAEKVVESLAHVANDRKRPLIVSLLTQSLCRLLLPTAADEWRQMSPDARKLHDFAIGRLNVVAPTWPLGFKSLKKRLEGALVFQASRNALALQTARAKQFENKTASANQKPTIQLKMDFAFDRA